MSYIRSKNLIYKKFQIYITKRSKSSIGLFLIKPIDNNTHYRGITIYHLFTHIRVEQIDSAFSKRAITPLR